MVFVLQKTLTSYKYVNVFGSQRQAEIFIESRIGEGFYDLKKHDFVITKPIA
jgi:hypothetical protein